MDYWILWSESRQRRTWEVWRKRWVHHERSKWRQHCICWWQHLKINKLSLFCIKKKSTVSSHEYLWQKYFENYSILLLTIWIWQTLLQSVKVSHVDHVYIWFQLLLFTFPPELSKLWIWVDIRFCEIIILFCTKLFAQPCMGILHLHTYSVSIYSMQKNEPRIELISVWRMKMWCEATWWWEGGCSNLMQLKWKIMDVRRNLFL